MRYLITKERIFYILAVTLLCIIMLIVTGVFTSTISATSISGAVYDNGMSIKQTKTVVSVVLSFWLGLLTPVVFIKTK
jgi:hypothetical protein